MKASIVDWRWALPLVAMGMLFAAELDARQFRGARPIPTPDRGAGTQMPAGAREVARIEPLSRAQVRPAVERVVEAWNTGTLDAHLSERFYDAARLGDAVDRLVARNARLRLQAVEGVQTLQQYVEDDPKAQGRERLVSRVSVTARTQIEFEGPTGNFVRRSGVNELLLKIVLREGER